MNYKELVNELRESAANKRLMLYAADAIEELLKAARAMHLWIFLNTGDEQKAYDECGLSDEMNAALGYGGKMVFRNEPPKEEHSPFYESIKRGLEQAINGETREEETE